MTPSISNHISVSDWFSQYFSTKTVFHNTLNTEANMKIQLCLFRQTLEIVKMYANAILLNKLIFYFRKYLFS